MSEELQETAPAEPIEQPTEDQVTDGRPQSEDKGQASLDGEPKRKASKSAREALEKAFGSGTETKPTDEEVEAAEKKAEPKEKPEAKAEPKKDAPKAAEKPTDGQKVEKATETKTDFAKPPSRFSADAKAEYEKAPEPVKAEIHRMQRELEKGLQEKDQRIKQYEPYEKMAKQSGTTVKEAMDRYINMENMLRSNTPQGLRQLAQNLGMHPVTMAAQALGIQPQALHKALQSVDPRQAQQPDPRDHQIGQLQRELQQMKQQFGQVNQTVQQQQHSAVMSQIEQFAADKPRFDELAPEIVRLIETGYAEDLNDAYTKAERLNPAPQPAPMEPTPAPPAQTRQARSLTGAPSPGSNPATKRTPSKSPRDALARHLFG